MKQIRKVPEYRLWLQKKLDEYGIKRSYLLAMLIALENTIETESAKLGRRQRPFYNLRNGNGDNPETWTCAAELAVWLRYKGYPAADYFQAVCTMPKVFGILKWGKRQVALNQIIPGFRKSGARLRRYEDHYLRWARRQ